MKINATKWNTLLQEELEKPYFLALVEYLTEEQNSYQIFPKYENIFKALELTDYDDVKAVIIGQDPYHQINQSHGLCFSVEEGIKFPPSLKNIFKELQDDLQIALPKSGNLEKWAKSGVLLLNTILTVRENEPNSHQGKGWEIFTNQIITLLNKREQPIVFILWGNYAKSKKKLITNQNHFIIEGVHPSPLSAYQGFFGKKYFSRCNQFLIDNKIEPIDWDLNK